MTPSDNRIVSQIVIIVLLDRLFWFLIFAGADKCPSRKFGGFTSA